MSNPEVAERRVTEADLRNQMQSFQDGVQNQLHDQKSTLLAVGGGVLVVLLLLFFLLGKRAGKRQTTLVEIRRV